jgi:hypothetical protein
VAELTERVLLVETMIDEHGRKLDELRTAVTGFEERMERRFQRFEEQLDRRFDHFELRFTAIDRRFTLIDQRFTLIDQRFAAVDQRFLGIDARLDKMTNLLVALLVAVIGGMGGVIAAILQGP